MIPDYCRIKKLAEYIREIKAETDPDWLNQKLF